MPAQSIARYGEWKSPISSDLIVAGTVGLGQICLDTDRVYWSESRPTEAGRNVIVSWQPNGTTQEINPAPFNARTRVHEYGGGAFQVQNGTVYFSNFADQQIYQAQTDSAPTALTAPGKLRYTNVCFDAPRDRLIAIREDHSNDAQEAVNTLVSIDLSGQQTVLAAGHDFFASPSLNADASKIAWLTWDHPNMPWDGTEVWAADIQADGSLSQITKVAGGPEESVFQPQWGPDGQLYFVSDRTDWWNLYRWDGQAIEAICPKPAEFGLPQWVFDMSTYGFADAHTLLCTYTEDTGKLATIDLKTLKLTEVAIPYTSISGLQVSNGIAAFVGGSALQPSAIVRLDLATGKTQELRRATDLTIDPGYMSKPRVVEFPTENGLTAYGLYYAPNNKDFAAPDDERPPLLVKSHGGPTASASGDFNLKIQYWTSRGFGFLDVDYGGSTGYGRAYRQRLNGNWGIVDVQDCVNGAKYLVNQDEVDGDRLVIAGGSAGGYTTLCALTFYDVFKAGASYYGVSDLEVLATDTHKFESRYMDSMIGPYPEQKQIYFDRSPINFVDQLSCPAIFFQGDEDKVVPPNQAEMMVDMLNKKGLPVAYVLYEGEQHGFRKAENIKRTLDGEFYFYSQVFGFQPADNIEPVEINNLTAKV
ncbi:S9 family peptidase [filamentous cyanobacterium LEGE 11480]|uniref:S9 family peptidase n=1 Tax=Romeriopsis navalis LEGE 11480 TaxID=2777977 RepID=A0A928VKU1_9CYAN|nr:S9 family peptidase [Romeriopsis navalis]MBE9029487.1 S9 family peptidase [Romeriopsis navalis LEGE 11480]